MKKKGDVGLTTAEVAQVKTMAAAGYSCRAIGRSLQRSAHTVKRFLSRPEVVRDVESEKQELATEYRGKARDILTSVDDATITKAGLKDRAIASGVFLDKSLALTGEAPVVLNVSALLDVAELLRDRNGAEQAWLAAHARIVSEGRPCIVPDCPIHSRPNLPALPGTTN